MSVKIQLVCISDWNLITSQNNQTMTRHVQISGHIHMRLEIQFKSEFFANPFMSECSDQIQEQRHHYSNHMGIAPSAHTVQV